MLIVINMEYVKYSFLFQDDFTLKGYRQHRESVDAPPPLTESEQLLQDINLSEVSDSFLFIVIIRNDKYDY